MFTRIDWVAQSFISLTIEVLQKGLDCLVGDLVYEFGYVQKVFGVGAKVLISKK